MENTTSHGPRLKRTCGWPCNRIWYPAKPWSWYIASLRLRLLKGVMLRRSKDAGYTKNSQLQGSSATPCRIVLMANVALNWQVHGRSCQLSSQWVQWFEHSPKHGGHWWPISMSKTAGSTRQRGWDASVPPCVLSQGGPGHGPSWHLAGFISKSRRFTMFRRQFIDVYNLKAKDPWGNWSCTTRSWDFRQSWPKVARINEPNHARTSVEESQGSWFKEMTLKYWTACKEAKEHRETQDQISEASDWISKINLAVIHRLFKVLDVNLQDVMPGGSNDGVDPQIRTDPPWFVIQPSWSLKELADLLKESRIIWIIGPDWT